MNILDQIIKKKRESILTQKEVVPIHVLEKDIATYGHYGRLKQTLKESSLGIIAEFKRKSPSLGWIQENAEVSHIVSRYESMGADALSILTDSPFFGGKPSDLLQARELTDLPILRKDFIIDEYQVLETAAWGADAILLIASALSSKRLKELAKLAKSIGLNTLLEIHSEEELDYLHDNIDIVGVNNRNLSTFQTDIKVSIELINKIPKEMLKISESGIHSLETLYLLKDRGYEGFLIGEAFMKQKIKRLSKERIEYEG